jgi:hypothetical protein
MQAAAGLLRNAEADRATLAPYAALLESVETKKITEWFVKYMGTAFHRDEAWFGPTMGVAALGVPQNRHSTRHPQLREGTQGGASTGCSEA